MEKFINYPRIEKMNKSKNVVKKALEEGVREEEPAGRWLKSNQVKKLFGLSESTLQKLRREGVLPFTKLGGVILYDYLEIIQILRRNRQIGND
ncbi:MAG TPA: helix-turn-helix domain-containing protein [Sphingobacteriaceae bacterium]|nr:helix-turn-helix domain-containing protein [Sphingobacteriaceae bacterium]